MVPRIFCCINHILAIFALLVVMSDSDREERIRLTQIFDSIFFVGNLLNNSLVTSLNARKIWEINQDAEAILRDRSVVMKRTYNHAMTVIIESGLIYTITHIVLLITVLKVSSVSTVVPIFVPILASIPTLIVLRAGMGVAVESVEQTVTTLTMDSMVILEPKCSSQPNAFSNDK
ncbi:hypothetical protein K435DRAFT_970943 [Dendrothele bispora CBS 962.96]|uniref:Uncharacterized protein n=1 Tax=Dendrothele bispora (strain CBS 962.96) TaxID=1314807 RepID=A0A4S8L8D2_DENBC|nr:hypothetical protein K435DRAFT_970943 [Dendrothele bispora CBS 962.96]